ncbi:MAG TPA: class I SAM-dependent methyltransferase [Streptosporangiaceae bacterium]|nr:class I SAM-dependent methyltransferase [Streptosporangiaceae bacterium]HVB45672.1 class I SAM-dependent methyltransferase [Streptosporangiaceae bacterium]
MDTSALRQATREHYEQFPFIEGGPRRVELWRDRLKRDLPDELIKGRLILDVGCGVGEVARSLRLRGAETVCVDLTYSAVSRNRALHPEARPCQADALSLPFAAKTFDHSMSIGVLHHTPDCRRGLAELARVTRPGGRIVVLLYASGTPYHLSYRLTAALRRKIPARSLDQLPGWSIPWLRGAVRGFTGQRLDQQQLQRMIADQFWTPQASFHSVRQVRSWASALGLDILTVRRIPLYSHVFVFRRLNL